MSETTPFSLGEPLHRYQCRVLYGDTDSGGVVYYANYLRYFEAARTELMRDWVSSYREIEEMGVILPVVECHTRYKASARYDDLLLVETCLLAVSPLSCRFNYQILRDDDRRLLVQGYTVHAAVGADGKLVRLPAELLAALRGKSCDKR